MWPCFQCKTTYICHRLSLCYLCPTAFHWHHQMPLPVWHWARLSNCKSHLVDHLHSGTWNYFSDPDRVKCATEKLVSLRINNSQHVHHYTITFKECTNELWWANKVLHSFYYWGLLDCIKDLWAWTSPPAQYDVLVDKAQKADLWYWCCIEGKRKNPSTSKPSTSKQRSSNQKSCSGMPTKSRQTSKSQSSSTPNKSTLNLSSTPQTLAKNNNTYKDLSTVLGPNGKLLLAEKEHHKKFGLCLCHGVKGDCPPPNFDISSTPKINKLASTFNTPKPKGHAAQAKAKKLDSEQAASADALDF